jgi:hypothetical protein
MSNEEMKINADIKRLDLEKAPKCKSEKLLFSSLEAQSHVI